MGDGALAWLAMGHSQFGEWGLSQVVDRCSGSRRRGMEKVDKRMVLEYTHGLFIT